MKLSNARFGFATNSSSTHSLIFLKEAKDHDCNEFGWNLFTAASVSARMRYVASHLYTEVNQFLPSAAALDLVESWTGCRLEMKNELLEGYVDHQSTYVLPRTADGEFIHREFFEEFKRFFMQKDLVILGGNDNDPDVHPLYDETAFVLDIPRDDYASWRVRREKDSYWTLFNTYNGTKVTFSFNKNAPDFVKSDRPGLVDLKITDFCDAGCAYCYQDSTTRGTHAGSTKVLWVLEALADLEVFEVAIGGGEPTRHPDFLYIIRYGNDCGITMNFTTKSLDWLHVPSLWTSVIENIGRFAYSVTRVEEVHNLAALLRINGIKRKASVQYVMGTSYIGEFEDIIDACGTYDFPVTLLGYKQVGRGKNFKPKDYSEWLEVIEKDNGGCEVGIDTRLAAQYEKEIKELGVPSWMFYTKEGQHSMYIDVVECKVGPSSYCDEEQMVPCDMKTKSIVERFKGYKDD